MAGYGEIARGFADAKWYPLSGAADVPGTGIDIPGGRSFTFQAEQDSEDWEGDDLVLATSFDNKTGTGSIAVARSNPTATASMLGGTATVSGTTPSEITTYDESAAANEIYGMLKAQANSKDVAGSAYRVTLAKAKVQSPSETLGLKAYNEPSSDLRFVANAAGLFIRREWFETGVVIPTTLP